MKKLYAIILILGALLIVPGTASAFIDTTSPTVIVALERVGEIDDDEGRFRVVIISCIDNYDPSPMITSVTLNGISVSNGQIVKLELDDDDQEVEVDDGTLEIEAPSFLLTVTCTDASGNVGTGTATPVFPDDDEDD